jgi:RimJ/RimL family protein N-acetyltransferase
MVPLAPKMVCIGFTGLALGKVMGLNLTRMEPEIEFALLTHTKREYFSWYTLDFHRLLACGGNGGLLDSTGTMEKIETVFETERLSIRRFMTADLQDTYEILSDPEVAKYEFWDAYSLDETREDIVIQAAVVPGTYEVWNEFAVVLKDGENFAGKVIGNISFKLSEPDQRQAEIGFHFNVKFHGMGYGKEAVKGLMGYLFQLGTKRIWAVSDPRNLSSWKMMEKLGMRREGHMLQNCFVKGEWCDEYQYAILESEWCKSNPVGRA